MGKTSYICPKCKNEIEQKYQEKWTIDTIEMRLNRSPEIEEAIRKYNQEILSLLKKRREEKKKMIEEIKKIRIIEEEKNG